MKNEYSSGPNPALAELVRKVDASFCPVIGPPRAYFEIGRQRFVYERLSVHAETAEDACQFMWEKYFKPYADEDDSLKPIFYRYGYKFSLENDGTTWIVRTRCYLDGAHGEMHEKTNPSKSFHP